MCQEGVGNRPARFTDDAEPLMGGAEGRVMCACGAMSPPGLSVHSAREWHIDHKFDVLDGGE